MLNSEILIKRLSYIKQLYNIGVNQSYQHESFAVFSILAFHDSIEMFLKLLAEHKGINTKNLNFLDYWEKIEDLTLKESMRNLNSRRVNIKHKGLLPAKSEIELSRVNTFDFFDQNTKYQFGVDFHEISLVNLISFSQVKEYLQKAESAIKNRKFEESVENSAYAFDELLYTYERNKSLWGKSPFYFGRSTKFLNSFSLGLSNRKKGEFGDLDKFIDTVTESIDALQKAVKITSLGIDYKEYAKFNILTPKITRTA
jgi:hypothetical protein